MQFLTILLVNILMGAVIYLLLSLKLAKKSSEYREQRFKREMDEIIKEFNITADRNISILENKISQVKKILQETGSLQGVDVIIGSESSVPETEKKEAGKAEMPVFDIPVSGPEMPHSKKGLPELLMHAIDTVREKLENVSKNKRKPELAVDTKSISADEGQKTADPYEKLIEKDLSSLNINDIRESVAETSELIDSKNSPNVSEEDVLQVIEGGMDKFGTVAELDRMGCSIEMIARYCEMPAGEIRLILNLQK